MSHFIAHTISFSKDFKTFKVKGGDNNVVPRMNYWSNPIPIDKLYYNINGGMIKLTGTAEKNCYIRSLVSETEFGGNWETETDYYHMKNKSDYSDVGIPEVLEFDRKFITRLREGLRLISNRKDFVIKFKSGSYIYKANPTHVRTTIRKEYACKFSYYRGMEILKSYKKHGAELI